jgi:hypothetical protein
MGKRGSTMASAAAGTAAKRAKTADTDASVIGNWVQTQSGDCNIPRFCQILGEFFLLLFCLRYLEIHKDLKLLSLFESFIRKLF